MVEVECPLCSETVGLDSVSAGTYECPYCNGNFEYEGSNGRKSTDSHPQEPFVWVALAIFGAVFLVLLFTYITESSWRDVEGEITSRYSPDSTMTEYEYMFQVDGETFYGEDECHFNSEPPYNCETYGVGDAVMISYNPENPSENEMVDNQVQFVLMCAFSIPVIVLGLGLFLGLRERGSSENMDRQDDQNL